MTHPRVAFVTCAQLPEPDPDQIPLLLAARDAGLDAHLLPWDDPDADPASFDLCVLRSTWNYHHDPDAFLDWTARAARESTLLNPEPVVRANIHKRYLKSLESQGFPVIPTRVIDRARPAPLERILDEEQWYEIVIKPAVSAGSFLTRRFHRDQRAEAQRFLDELVAQRDVLVQKFMPEVTRRGERCIICIDGELTHTIRKEPRFHEQDESVSDALPVEDEERDFALRILDAAGARGLLYARIDTIRDDSTGDLRLTELELIEPSLFLIQHPPAMERLVSAIAERAYTAPTA